MKQYQTLTLLILLVANCYGLPLDLGNEEENPELTAGFVEGDMDIDFNRNGDADLNRRWPNAIAYYRISDEYDEQHVTHIREAMNAIEDHSCIKFRNASENATAYISITPERIGCFSKIGYRGNVQGLNLENHDLYTGCFVRGTIIHELLHTLGFYHQHNVPERDEYVRIEMKNVKENSMVNFNKYGAAAVTNFGVEYDYDSIMHYHARAYSKNGEMTIIPLGDEERLIGQRIDMSRGDIIKLNAMYNCRT